MKKAISLLLVFTCYLFMTITIFASEPEIKLIHVKCEEDILAFYNSPEYDSDFKYEFTYSTPSHSRILCPKCGYNSYITRNIEKYNLNDPASQGRVTTCPAFLQHIYDVIEEKLVYTWQECKTCGYQTEHLYKETKWYVYCPAEGFEDTTYVATDYKTLNRIGDIHEWKDYVDPAWTLGCDGP